MKPTKQRTLQDLERLMRDYFFLDVGISLLAGNFKLARKLVKAVRPVATWPYFVHVLIGATVETEAERGDFALRDLLTEYPGLRMLCETLPEGMTEEWEEVEE